MLSAAMLLAFDNARGRSTLGMAAAALVLLPLLLLLLRRADVSNTVAGLFAATSWLGIFIITPFASQLTRRIGRRRALWLASTVPLATAFGFLLTTRLEVWFALELCASVAGGLRWVLAESFIAEFTPPDQRGRYIGAYATMIGLTFVVGPALLAWLGDGNNVLNSIVEAAVDQPGRRILVDLAAQTHDPLATWMEDAGVIG